MLYRGKPAVVTYRHRWISIALAHLLKQVPYISLVNLLADRPLYPEYFGTRCEAEAMAAHVLRWLEDRAAYEGLCGELAALRERVAEPGACGRAADYVLGVLRGTARPQAA
jgi:lipid-A-disaccharide synthase